MLDENEFYNLTVKVNRMFRKQDEKGLRKLFEQQDIYLVSRIIDAIDKEKKSAAFSLLSPRVQAAVIVLLRKGSKRAVLPKIGRKEIADFLYFNDEDDAVDILQYLPESGREKVLAELRDQKRIVLQKLLKYHPETAGGIMDLNFIIVSSDFIFRDVVKKFNEHIEKKGKSPTIIVENKQRETIGFLPVESLVVHGPSEKIESFVKVLSLIDYRLRYREVMKYVRAKREIIGVIGSDKSFLGVIRLDDLMEIAQKEATKALYRFAGVKEDYVLDSVFSSFGKRYKWLIVNLFTAMLAALVVSLFQDSLNRFVVLAVYMPVIGSMSGNAGTQSLAVIVRGITLGEVTVKDGVDILMKEMAVGALNGVLIGLIVGFIGYFWNGSAVLGLILAASMVINLFIAGLFGALIPISLKVFKIDPALAASVFITAATDIFGFIVFLGLASMYL